MSSGYATVLRLVVDHPGSTWLDIADRANCGRVSVQTMLHHLVDAEILHEAAWAQRRVNVRSVWMPTYAIGEGGPLLSWPGEGERKRRKRTPPPVELLTFIHAVRALQADSHGRASLAEVTGLSPRTAGNLLRQMHALRLIYIDEYPPRPVNGPCYPVYTWGIDMKDAKRPAPISKRELWTQWNRIRTQRRRGAEMLGLLAAETNTTHESTPCTT